MCSFLFNFHPVFYNLPIFVTEPAQDLQSQSFCVFYL